MSDHLSFQPEGALEAWSSDRIFTGSMEASQLIESAFARQYNHYARQMGLPLLEELSLAELPDRNSVESLLEPMPEAKNQPKTFLQKLLRPSPVWGGRSRAENENRKAGSTTESDYLKTRRLAFRYKSLAEMIRLGGINVLYLTYNFSPNPLALPTSICACAIYLIHQGIATPGVFRISGGKSVVNALYDYYIRPEEDSASMSQRVQQTIGNSSLPSDIAYSVHDVASLFKKLLSKLPGGILGSTHLFLVLRDIHACQDEDRIPIMIACAIGAIRSQYRIAIICATFGILSMVGQTTSRAANKGKAKDLMTTPSLAIIFGPLLLSDLAESTQIEHSQNTAPLHSAPESSSAQSRRPFMNRLVSAKTDRQAKALERAGFAIEVSTMLITHWPEIVRCLRQLKAVYNGRELVLSSQRAATLEVSRNISLPELSSRHSSYNIRSVPGKFQPALTSQSNISLDRVPLSQVDRWPHSEALTDPLRSHPITPLADKSNSKSVQAGIGGLQNDEGATKREEADSASEYSRSPTGAIQIFAAPVGPPQRRRGPELETEASAKALRRRAGVWQIAGDMQGLNDVSKEPPAASEELASAVLEVESMARNTTAFDMPQSSDEDTLANSHQDLISTQAASLQAADQEGASDAVEISSIFNDQLLFVGDIQDNDGKPDLTDSIITRPEPAHFRPPGLGRSPIRTPSRIPLPTSVSPSSKVDSARSMSPGVPLRQLERLPSSKDLIRPEMLREEALPRRGSDMLPSKASKRKPVPTSPKWSGGRPGHSRRTSPSKPSTLVAQNKTQSPITRRPRPANLHLRDRPVSIAQSYARQLTLKAPGNGSIDALFGGDAPALSPGSNASLFEEIQRLTRKLELAMDEAAKSKQELEAMRAVKDAGTLSEQLRETHRELESWKGRAERAERLLDLQVQERDEAELGTEGPKTAYLRKRGSEERATLP
ncbi:MAG: hypothetical protein M1814_004194 [Vezdaea aestivalis]|nr:MAG: hypothetical protein M1814_004194 [Vezdaea aestivalis]